MNLDSQGKPDLNNQKKEVGIMAEEEEKIEEVEKQGKEKTKAKTKAKAKERRTRRRGALPLGLTARLPTRDLARSSALPSTAQAARQA